MAGRSSARTHVAPLLRILRSRHSYFPVRQVHSRNPLIAQLSYLAVMKALLESGAL
jgi:hypothetical protein